MDSCTHNQAIQTYNFSFTKSKYCGDTQAVFFPVALLAHIGTTVGEFVKIKCDFQSFAICRVLPVCDIIDSQIVCMKDVYGICQLSSNNTSNHGFQQSSLGGHEVLSCSYDQIHEILQPLETVELNSLVVSIILNSVSDVLQHRTSKETFEISVTDLVRLYAVQNKVEIDCLSNPLAGLLVVCRIQIEQCDVNIHQVGRVTADTVVTLNRICSEDKLRTMVQSPSLLGGIDSAILSHLKALITDPWNLKEIFSDVGVRYPSGVLLVGPPGCGKTSLVRQICWETQTSLIGTASAELASAFEGEMEDNFAKVARMACQLSQEAQCVFFIDEIESLVPIRSSHSNSSHLHSVAQILQTLDQCHKCSNLVVMAATNRPFDIDSTLRRSGRFETEILLNVPTVSERASILKIHTQQLLINNASLMMVAQATPGFSGADLKELVNSAQQKWETKLFMEGPEPDILEQLLQSVSLTTPSIFKTLDFVTCKMPPMKIGGLKKVKEELERIFHHRAQFSIAYKKIRLRRPRGVLLFGPRGCGKTRLVATVASRHNCSFLSANASHLLSPYVGESERRVLSLFHAARLAQPTVLFIDEIDGIFGRRDGSSGVQSSLINELLQAIDGCDVAVGSLQGSSILKTSANYTQDDGILICAATNKPWSLDPALLRPGRFDKLIYVPLPDLMARLDILQTKTEKIYRSECLSEIAEKTEGFTGAELENIIMKAAKESALQCSDCNNDRLILQENNLTKAVNSSKASVTISELKRYQDFMN